MAQWDSTMESMGLDSSFWKNKRVFVTGHTGFKGSWLCLWLQNMGAVVTGYALSPESKPNLFELAEIAGGMTSNIGDILDQEKLRNALVESRAEIVFHLAAQPLVRASYQQPVETFATNIMGTAHLLESAKECPSIKVIQIITTDKVYKNYEWPWPYRENDTLGGYDPYSASKAACELIVSSYRQSFFMTLGVSVSTARAGNVIGGGDWAADRLIPDCIRAFIEVRPVTLRQPESVRPWQHVLDPLMGYLLLAQRQWEEAYSSIHSENWRFSQAFNFGPDSSGEATVGEVAKHAAITWGEQAKIIIQNDEEVPHEAGLLTLDPSLARQVIGWKTQWPVEQAIKHTVSWYRRQSSGESAKKICLEQISSYQQLNSDR
jgi:CDP-glucose 4,6-dehydratase